MTARSGDPGDGRRRRVCRARGGSEPPKQELNLNSSSRDAARDRPHAAFYTYFRSKLEAFTEVLRRGPLSELEHTRMPALHEPVTTGEPGGPTDAEVRSRAYERIGVAVQRYFSSYSRHALLLLRVDEAIGVHPELIPLRLELHQGFADHIAASLRHGRADDAAVDHLRATA